MAIDEAMCRAAMAWEDVDRVAGQPQVTDYKRSLRLHQSQWRSRNDIPIGHKRSGDAPPIALGSRIDSEVANTSGVNFLSDRVRAAVRRRLDAPEKHQTINTTRLFTDLLSSMPMCFNLFGELDSDPPAIERAIRAWFPDAPIASADLAFEWSPGRLDPNYLGNRSAFDAAFLLDLPDGGRGVIGVETKYHEHAVRERRPSEDRLSRYREVSERSAVFVDGAVDRIIDTPLQQIWLDHLLVLSMLQHPTGKWQWGRFVLVNPAGNKSFRDVAEQYRAELVDTSTFEVRTVEELLAAPSALSPELVAVFRDRYLP